MENGKATLVLESECQDCFWCTIHNHFVPCLGCGIQIFEKKQTVAVKDGKVVAWLDN